MITAKGKRSKGQKGEREVCDLINKKFGTEYKRTPMSGGLDIKGDIRRGYGSKSTRIDDYSFEIKRQEKLNIHKAMRQSTNDARGNIPVVVHRKNNDDWLLTFKFDDFLDLVKELDDLSKL